MPFRFTTIARLEADWAIAHSNCKAHTIFIYASDSDGHKQMAHAYQQELTSKCGSGCSVTMIGLPFSDWPTKLQSDIQSTLAANPSVNWVIPVVDFGVQFALPAINASGKANGQVKIATFNGTPSVLKELRDGNIVDMEMGENLNWNAYADLDQTFRVMLGQKPVADERLRSGSSARPTSRRPVTLRVTTRAGATATSRAATGTSGVSASEAMTAASSARNEASPAPEPATLSLTGLAKSFGGVQALRGVDLIVRKGEVHGLVGENGSGKSTLIKTLAGFHAPRRGNLGDRRPASAAALGSRRVPIVWL